MDMHGYDRVLTTLFRDRCSVRAFAVGPGSPALPRPQLLESRDQAFLRLCDAIRSEGAVRTLWMSELMIIVRPLVPLIWLL